MCFSNFFSIVGATALKPSICMSSGMLPATIKPSVKVTLQAETPANAQACAIGEIGSALPDASVLQPMAFLSIGLKTSPRRLQAETLISCKQIVQFSFAGAMPASGTVSR